MLYKSYGNTGKEISAVSCGGMRFANPEDIDANAEVIVYAHSKGINYLDTAPGYCADKSEEIFGAAIKQLQPGTYYTSTKCMASNGDDLRKSLEQSLTRMNVDKITFFHIWCLVRMEQWQERQDGGAVAAALKAKEEGLIEHVVFSTHLPGDDAVKVMESGYFEGVTLGYNAINFPYRQKAVDAAEKMKLGVITMNPLSGGLIPNHAERFDFIRSEADADVVQAAIRFNVSQPGITSALVGFTTKEHVDQAVAAVEDFQPYEAAHIEKVKAELTEKFDGLCTGCGYCLPCPSELNIPRLMDSYNMKILANDDVVMGRLRYHWNIDPMVAADCTECGSCEDACTQSLPIIERMAAIAEMGEQTE